jgi:predicted nuclease of restriction endonuclease-like (RecB) superfamily
MSDQLKQIPKGEQELINKLSLLIEQSKEQIVVQANNTLTLLFWHIGKNIKEFVLNNKRADYGKQIVSTISTQLVSNYGKNFVLGNLRRMIQFFEIYPNFEIVVPLARQLSWSHFIILIPLKTDKIRFFYAQMAMENRWGKRELRKQIERKAYERAVVANNQLPTNITGTKNLFKDPYLLDFLKLKDDFLEKNLEEAILLELEKFILELGKGFTFVERQKRMIIDGEDFKLDLLFFHRKLKRLVAIELKIGKFKAQYKGQMELYLKWLNKYEKQEGEKEPIGLILCTEASKEQIELLEMHKDGIMVAEYWTDLPPKNVLEQKLQQAVLEAKERLERRKLI